MEELNLGLVLDQYSQETVVLLEFCALLCGTVSIFLTKRKYLFSYLILLAISASCVWLAWRSSTAIAAITMLLTTSFLVYLERGISDQTKETSNIIGVTSPSKSINQLKMFLWGMLFIGISATLLLRILQIGSLLEAPV